MKATGRVKPFHATVWLQRMPGSPDEPHPQLNGLTLSPISAGASAPKETTVGHLGLLLLPREQEKRRKWSIKFLLR